MPLLLVSLTGASACADRAADEAAATAARAEQAAAEEQARAARAAALEVQRLAELWTYHTVPVERGTQVTASIRSANSVDTDASGARSVQLVFREHPAWGRSSYLVLQAGDFDCAPRCTVNVTVDDGAPRAMAARRPNTDEAIAMFINDADALWRLTSDATRLSIEFPVRTVGTRTASFDVGGLDDSSMPGWGS